MTNPTRRNLLPYAVAIAVAVACIFTSVLIGRQIDQNTVAKESQRRVEQLQDVICRVYVPIGNSPLPAGVSVLGKTIVAATRQGAVDIHCPGIK